MSEETKQALITVIGIVLAFFLVLSTVCFHTYVDFEKTKIYLEKGYHLVDGDWLK